MEQCQTCPATLVAWPVHAVCDTHEPRYHGFICTGDFLLLDFLLDFSFVPLFHVSTSDHVDVELHHGLASALPPRHFPNDSPNDSPNGLLDVGGRAVQPRQLHACQIGGRHHYDLRQHLRQHLRLYLISNTDSLFSGHQHHHCLFVQSLAQSLCHLCVPTAANHRR